jgi:DNA-binding IclR family transcriptional regulator
MSAPSLPRTLSLTKHILASNNVHNICCLDNKHFFSIANLILHRRYRLSRNSLRERAMPAARQTEVRAGKAAGQGESFGAVGSKPVGAVIASLTVLRHLAHAPAPLPLSRIARDLSLNTSTCLNILRTLAQENYVSVDPHAKLYSIGLGVLELASGALSRGGDLSGVRNVLDGISQREGATITLWRRLSIDRMLLVLESLPASDVGIKMNIGQRLPLMIGAAGRIMAAHAHLPEDEMRRQFDALRMDEPISHTEFFMQVREAAERGWAFDDGNYSLGTSSVAVPVLDRSGTAVFALSATVFSARFSLEWAGRMAGHLAKPAALLASAQPYL